MLYKTRFQSLGASIMLVAAAVSCSGAFAASDQAPATADTAAATSATQLAEGQKLAFDTLKGNCLACHQIEAGESPGNIGPPLQNMQTRYPDRAKLRAQIWDATVANPESSMPPFGRHRLLTEQEIDQITTFIWTK